MRLRDFLTGLLILLAAFLVEILCSLEWANDAHADEPDRVTPGLLCSVQNKIRWGDPAWTPDYCERVAAALNRTPNPREMAARMVNESDMDPTRMRFTLKSDGSVAVDVGLMAVRCVLRGADARAAWRSVSVRTQEQLERNPPRGRCTNEPARGLTIKQLQDPTTSIKLATLVLATKKRPGNYNASDPVLAARYESKIAILTAALAGLPVDVKKIHGKRMRELLAKIREAFHAAQRRAS